MKLNDLDEQELTAFMALLKQLIRADGELSDTEIDHLAALGEALGEEAWKTAYDGVKGKYRTKADIPVLAGMVSRLEARKLIHRILTTVASSDATTPEEQALLTALSGLWGITAPLPGLPNRKRRKRGLIK